MRVLIVDDNADDRKLLRYNLERHGYRAVEACDGRCALALLKDEPFELIVSDALMPEMDGFELLWAVRNDLRLKHIPFIFYSAVYTGAEDEQLAYRLGADAFLTKPMTPEQLWREVSAVVEKRASATFPADTAAIDNGNDYLREYSRVVATKLEEKVRELEESLARREEAEEELLKLSSAIEQSPVSIVITDVEGKIEFVNPKFLRAAGYAPEEVLGRNPRFLKSGESPPEVYQELWRTISAGSVWHGEFHNRKKSGELFWAQATIAPVRNREGVVTHYLAIEEDITERKKLEDQLRQSQKMEAIGQLAGCVAHDFNNLLQAITTYGFLIQQQLKEHGLPAIFIDEQMAAARRAAEVAGGLLTFSRKQPLYSKALDLNRVLAESRKLLTRLIGEDISFEAIPAPEEVVVWADEGGLHQVLMNLATNARDAMPKGGSFALSLSTLHADAGFGTRHRQAGPGDYAVIAATDTGAGIAPEDRQRIFEPFFTTKETGKGTGLGLAIIYGIIRQHNGFIEVESVQGKGTTFRVYLPLYRGEGNPVRQEPAAAALRGSGTILLVEDEAMVRHSLRAVMTGAGYSVLEAADGDEAVRVFREHADGVNLVILDMVLPKKNGWEVFREIRSIRPGVRNIFLSGYTGDILESKGIEETGAHLIEKPVSPPLLLEAIRRILQDG